MAFISKIGIPGPVGPVGPGVPAGGYRGAFLRKKSDASFDTEWCMTRRTEIVIIASLPVNSIISAQTSGEQWIKKGDTADLLTAVEFARSTFIQFFLNGIITSETFVYHSAATFMALEPLDAGDKIIIIS